MTIRIPGQLEIDTDRGVIYFHTTEQEIAEKYGSVTVLRICSLPTPIPETALDITHMYGASWCAPIKSGETGTVFPRSHTFE